MLLLTASGAAAWLVALPRVASTEAMSRRIEAARRAGINPGAVFYTEHAIELPRDQSPGAANRSK